MSKYTAIVRKKLSLPMKILRTEIEGDCLDYGCGRGFDCDFLGIDGYDPYWRNSLPNKKYDRIFCNFVLNVVTKKQQNKIIKHIQLLLKDNGIAYFTVRRDIKHSCKGRGCIQRVVKLDLTTYYLKKSAFEIYEMKV